MDVVRTHSFPLFVSVSLWPFVRSSAGLINHTHTGVRRGFIAAAAGWSREH